MASRANLRENLATPFSNHGDTPLLTQNPADTLRALRRYYAYHHAEMSAQVRLGELAPEASSELSLRLTALLRKAEHALLGTPNSFEAAHPYSDAELLDVLDASITLLRDLDGKADDITELESLRPLFAARHPALEDTSPEPEPSPEPI